MCVGCWRFARSQVKLCGWHLTGTKCNRRRTEGLFTPVFPLAARGAGQCPTRETSSNATTTQSLSLHLSPTLLPLPLSLCLMSSPKCRSVHLRLKDRYWSDRKFEVSHENQPWPRQLTSSNATITQQSLCPSCPSCALCPPCPLVLSKSHLARGPDDQICGGLHPHSETHPSPNKAALACVSNTLYFLALFITKFIVLLCMKSASCILCTLQFTIIDAQWPQEFSA